MDTEDNKPTEEEADECGRILPRILLIDDDEQLRSMTKQMLERANYQVEDAPSGPLGLEKLRAAGADVVITDLIMPEQDGLMLIQQILTEFPHTRILAISGGPKGNPAWLPIAKKAGARAVLKKPFQKDKLLETVKGLVMSPH